MSDVVDIIEHMFEYVAMETASAPRTAPARAGRGVQSRTAVDHVGAARAALERITALRSRIDDMQPTRVDDGLPTASVLAPLLPGGAIRAGGTYAVHESLLLAMTMLQAASESGAWCAVVGVPSFGAEAAAAMGIDLERLVLVPEPGDQWLGVTSALVDVASVVLVRPMGRVTPGDTARISARLRQRRAALVSLGAWAGTDATLRVTTSAWQGIGNGFGSLGERRVTVTASGRAAARPVHTELLLPAADGTVRTVEPIVRSAAVPESGRVPAHEPVAVAS
jgi:hypothetical protein